MFKRAANIHYAHSMSKDIHKFSKSTIYDTLSKKRAINEFGRIYWRHKVVNYSLFSHEYLITDEEYLTQEEAYEFFGYNPADW